MTPVDSRINKDQLLQIVPLQPARASGQETVRRLYIAVDVTEGLVRRVESSEPSNAVQCGTMQQHESEPRA